MEFNGTFLATIVTFVMFVILMNKVLYSPILSIMEERKNIIDNNYKTAHENDTKIAQLSSEKEEKLTQAREDAKGKYNEILDEFKEQRLSVVAEAQNSAKGELERSSLELENVSNEVKIALKGSMTNLANDIVEKVIGYHSEVQHFDEDVVNKVLWEK